MAAAFTEEEKAVDDALGFPKAYARLCRGGGGAGALGLPYSHGPPHGFLPYVLHPHEALRAKDLNEMFPVTDAEAAPTANPRGFANLLWKQLDHLGNAGFDPALFRIDAYGNVLYLHADCASPLAWDIDHWFPCARGGRTVPSNLRIVQSQVCRKKHNKMEFLVPWWDLQLGISVNQFLSIFASKNADFRNRAFAFLFADGASEELTSLQAVEAHAFPHHFSEMKKKVGLAPAAIVSSRGSDNSVLKSLDANRSLRPNYPLIAAKKFTSEKDENANLLAPSHGPNSTKENNNPDADGYISNPYLSIATARDSLRQREEAKKKQAELTELENEATGLKQKNEEERVTIQDMESLLIKRRRRVEKCRRLAEAQSNYKAVLEKMIRDAMHQSVVYKEQLRLNQAATSTLMARLEAQRAMCDSSETELRRKYQQKDELEKQIKPFTDQARKRYRVDDGMLEERPRESVTCLPGRRLRSSPLKQELRIFLEEDQRTSDAYISLEEEEIRDGTSTMGNFKNESFKVISFPRRSMEDNSVDTERGRASVREKLEHLAIKERQRGRRRERTMASRGTSTPGRSRDGKDKEAIMLQCESETEKSQTISLPRTSSVPPSPYRATGMYGMPRYPTEQSVPLQKNEMMASRGTSTPGRSRDVKGKAAMLQCESETEKSQTVSLPRTSSVPPSPPYRATGMYGMPRYPTEQSVPLQKNEMIRRRGVGRSEDGANMNHSGKVTVDKWLHMLMEEQQQEDPAAAYHYSEDHTVEEVASDEQQKPRRIDDEITECSDEIVKLGGESATEQSMATCRNSFDIKERGQEKKIWFPRTDSSRGFRSLPSSPSKIVGMTRSVECISRKPKVIGVEDSVSTNSSKFLSRCKQAIKKAVK
ncbi:hypothetical protein GUJ93_ZPchr0001g32981 [Zizania palustris]|uniref:Uncharacterized protein n=1 Tax=Zizania palustris TaxID=103762 RepID=A0A8J5V7T5_ZIZPA|nr:hypothetical protein GUJ93_ZPchr0001g32981 [Zizania palustris]